MVFCRICFGTGEQLIEVAQTKRQVPQNSNTHPVEVAPYVQRKLPSPPGGKSRRHVGKLLIIIFGDPVSVFIIFWGMFSLRI